MSIEDEDRAEAGVGSGLYAPRFEAALNLMREERRAAVEARLTILRDRDLEMSQPGHHHQLLVQTMREIGQLTRAIDVLDRMERGELIEEALAAALPPIRARRDAPMRIMVLRPASPAEPRPGASA